MAVTRETYTANATWGQAEILGLLKDAFIDAGLMTDWHDEFAINGRDVKVLAIEHDDTKTYGTSYYIFHFGSVGNLTVSLVSGWDSGENIPTGTQYLDYERLPADYSTVNGSGTIIFTASVTSDLHLDRVTSGDDAKQSWFVFRQGGIISSPFSILHKDTVLHPWLDLSKGIVSGFSGVKAAVNGRMGFIYFTLEENIRRALSIGTALRGSVNSLYHGLNYNQMAYFGLGAESTTSPQNVNFTLCRGTGSAAGFALPVGINANNPAYTTDYVPICSDLPWSIWTPTRLADDFGIYMHYAANDIGYGHKFIVQSAINEWETLSFANNASVNVGASAAFLTRVI